MATYDISDLAVLPEVVKAVLEAAPAASSTATVFALHGDLGAGKTTFVQHIARQLGVTEVVTSPTFVIMKGYETESEKWQQLIHIDAYRFENESEAGPLHLSEILATSGALVCLEWAERVASLLPEGTVHLHFTLQGSTRTLEVK